MKNLAGKLLVAALAILLCTLGASAKTYIVAVGLDRYQDPSRHTLTTPVSDVRSLCKFFDNYDQEETEIFMLKNENATRAHVLKILKKMFAKSTEADQVIFAYSGHGFDGGVTTYDGQNVVFCSEIQDIMKGTKARRKVMFINSCHSGSFSKKYKNDPRVKKYKSNNSNVMIYVSSRAEEVSWENSAMDNSYFYAHLLAGLRGYADANNDKKVTARELFNYVNAKVINATDGKQHPQMYGKFPDDMVVVYVD